MTAPAVQATRTGTFRVFLVYADGQFAEVAQEADADRLNPEQDMLEAPDDAIAVRYRSDKAIVFNDPARTHPACRQEEDDNVYATHWLFFCSRVTVLSQGRVAARPAHTAAEQRCKRAALDLMDAHEGCEHVAMFTVRGGAGYVSRDECNKRFYPFFPGKDDVVDFPCEDAS